MSKTLLIYCGDGRQWSDDEIRQLGVIHRRTECSFLLMDTFNNPDNWEDHSVDMAGAMRGIIGEYPFYVASLGGEAKQWADFFAKVPGFLGFYWNGGEERPDTPPPRQGLHGHPYTLWIPYTAGTWGVDNIAYYLDSTWVPNSQIAMQPNVYQPNHDRGFWDMYRCWRAARRYGLRLEFEYDERMLPSMRWYKLFNKISPSVFSCVYGGAKAILRVEEVM